MKLQFFAEPSDDTDDYLEIYTAVLTLANDMEVVIRASESDVSYDAFRADVMEDCLRSICSQINMPFEIENQDYSWEPEDELGGVVDGNVIYLPFTPRDGASD